MSDLIKLKHETALREAAAVCPQPVAAAGARILRARSEESLIDAILKAGEVLARYVTMLGLASYAARDSSEGSLPYESDRLDGPISFGSFLEVSRALGGASIDHPLRSQIAAGFVAKGKANQSRRGPTEEALSTLLELRNELGHDLSSLSRSKAIAVLRDIDPLKLLNVALDGVEGLLSFPLFVVEEQVLSGGRVKGRRLLLMGDSADPEPESIELELPGLHHPGLPYVGFKQGAIRLSPLLVWDVAPASENFRLFLLDSISEGSVKHKAVDSQTRTGGEEARREVSAYLLEARVPMEAMRLARGASFSADWRESRKARQLKRIVPWESFDPETVRWFATRLEPGRDEATAQDVVSERLLDDREFLNSREHDQLILLFGQETPIRRLLRREMIDLRARKDINGRWDERIESHSNVLACLKEAVDFFMRNFDSDEDTGIEGLHEMTGSADYIAMREALVNFFIHQDYTDASAAAQVELTPDRAVFFNPGRALVSTEALVEGGKSQARNPIIARALRLLGFAELAGSGLRELQRTWRGAKRRPPRMESDESANTFTLTLDWREIPNAYDEFWKDKIGVQLTESEAKILNLAFDTSGVSLEEAASATDGRLEDANQALGNLVRQVLVDEDAGRFRVKEHLRELAK